MIPDLFKLVPAVSVFCSYWFVLAAGVCISLILVISDDRLQTSDATALLIPTTSFLTILAFNLLSLNIISQYLTLSTLLAN